MSKYVKHDGVWKEPADSLRHDGVWKDKETWVKHDGVWKRVDESVLWLYDEGEYEDDWVEGSERSTWGGESSRSKESDHLYLYGKGGYNTLNDRHVSCYSEYATAEAIELASGDKIVVDWQNTGSSSIHNESLLLIKTYVDEHHHMDGVENSFIEENTFNRTEKEYTLYDLPLGNYFVCVIARGNQDGIESELRVYKVSVLA